MEKLFSKLLLRIRIRIRIKVKLDPDPDAHQSEAHKGAMAVYRGGFCGPVSQTRITLMLIRIKVSSRILSGSGFVPL
jgi:hypothetical protein